MGIQTIELLLDKESETAVRDEWQALEQAGLRTAEPLARPHVTLTARERIDPRAEQDVRRRLAALPLVVRLGAPLLFRGPDRVILVRSIVPTAALLELQADIHATLGEVDGASSLSLPDAWSPHVTLTRLPLDDIRTALKLIMKHDDREITLTAARRWDGTAKKEWDLEPAVTDAAGATP